MREVKDVAGSLLKLLPYIHEKFLRPLEHVSRSRLSKIQFYAVSMLHRKGPLMMSELAALIQVSKQQLTPLVDRLIEQGTVERKADPSDRRIVYIELTSEGKDLIEGLWSETKQALGEKLRTLPEEELEELEASLLRVRSILEKIE